MTAEVRSAGLSTPKRAASRRRRLGLLASSALIGTALLASPAHAQILPELPGNPPLPVTVDGADIAVSGNEMTIDLNDASRIIDFASYNIGLGDTVTYTTDNTALTGLVAVNRVLTGGGASQIDGSIVADLGGGNSISVWLINQEGIAFGSDATFSGGSLMLSTLDFSDTVDAAFRTAFAVPGAATATPFSFSGASTSPIVIASPGLGVTGSLVAVGQSITVDGAQSMANGPVVLVAGTDVTFGSGLGNPLSFTINAGTAIGGAVTVNAGLTGESVILAGGIQDNLTAALLNVDAAATLTATADGGTVTLATASTGGITINNGVNPAPSIALGGDLVTLGAASDVVVNSAAGLSGAGGIDATGDALLTAAGAVNLAGTIESGGSIAVNAGTDATLGGDLTAATDVLLTVGGNAQVDGAVTPTAQDIIATVGGNAAFAGTLTAGRDIDLAAGGTMAVAGNVTAGRDYLASGTGVTLGTDGEARAQDAGGLVTVQATANDVTGRGTLALSSGGGSDITLQADAGQVAFAATTAVNAGTGDVIVTSAPAITLGDVTAANLFTAGDTALTAAGPISTGDLTVANALTIRASAGSVATGNVTVQTPGAALNILAGGAAADATTGALATDRGDILISAGRDITLASASTALTDPADAPVAGSIGLYAGRDIQTGALIAGEDIAALASGSITATDLTAGDDLLISAFGNVSVANGTVRGSGADNSAILFAGLPGAMGSLSLAAEAPATLGSVLQLSSSGDVLSSGTLANEGSGPVAVFAGGGIDLNSVTAADGSISLQSSADSINAANLGAGNNVTATAFGNVAIGNATATTGLIDIAATGDVDLDTGLARTGIEIDAGGSIRSANSLANDAGDVRLTAGLSVTANDVTTDGGSAILTATTGSVTATNIDARLGVDATAGLDINITTTIAGTALQVNAGRDARVDVGSAGSFIDIVAGGAITSNVSLTAFAGDATLNAGTAIDVADVTGVGGGALLTAANAVTASAVQGDTVVDVQAGTDATLASASSGNMLIVGAVGDISIETADAAGTIDVDAGGAITSATSLTAFGDVLLTAGQGIAVNFVQAGGIVDMAAGTSVTGQDVNAASDINVLAGTDADLALATAQGALRVNATDTAFVDGVGVMLVDIRAGGSIVSGTSLSTGAGDVLLDAGQDITVNAVAANFGTASLTALGSITGADISADGDIVAFAGADIDLANATTGGTLDVDAVGNARVDNGAAVSLIDIDGSSISSSGTLQASSGNVLLDTPGFIDVADVFAGLSANLTAGDFIGAALVSATNVNISAGTSATLGILGGAIDVNAGTDVSISDALSDFDINITAGNNAVIGSADAQGSLFVNAGGDATVNFGHGRLLLDVVAGGNIASNDGLHSGNGDVRLRAAGNVAINDVNADGNADITAITGAMTGDTLFSGIDIAVSAGTDATLASATSDTGSIRVSAGNNAFVGAGTAGTFIDINAGNNASLGTGSAATLVDIDAGGAIASASSLSTTAGDILLDAAGDIGVTALNAGGGSANLTSTAGSITGANVSADIDVIVTAANDVGLTVAAAGGTLDVDAGGNASVGTGSAGTLLNIRAGGSIASAVSLATIGGNVLLNAAQDVAIADATASGSVGILAGGTASAATLTAEEDVAVRAGNGVTIAFADARDDLDATALAGTLTLTDGRSRGAPLGSGNTSVAFTDVAGVPGAVSVTNSDPQPAFSNVNLRAQAGDLVSTGTLRTSNAGHVLVSASGNIAVATVDADGGNATLTSTGGSVSGTSVSADLDVDVSANTNASLTSASAGGALNVDAGGSAAVGTGHGGTLIDIDAGGTITSATSLTTTGGNVLLTAGGNITLATAGGSGDASITSTTGSVTAANLGAGGNTTVSAATDAALTSASAGGALSVDAGGNASVGTGQGGTLIDIDAGGTITSATSLTVTGGDVLLTAGGNIGLATVTTGGSGNAAVNSTTGSITAASLGAGGNATVSAATDAALTSASAGGALDIDAGGNAAVGTGQAATLIAIDAGGTITSATALTATGGDVRLTAGGVAALGQMTANAAGAAIVVDATDVVLNGAITANTGGTITLRNVAAGPTVVGDAPKTTGPAFTISDAELDRLTAETVVIDAMANDLELATLSIAAGTGSGATRFLSAGDVELTGPFAVAPTDTPRTLQIGGELGELGDDAGAVNMARTIIARVDEHENPSIDAGSAIIELRGQKVLFGTGAMVDAYLPLPDEAIADFVGDRGSLLYIGAPLSTPETFLTAREVTVAYQNFALFQNTRPTQFGGVAINSAPGAAPDPTQLAIRLVSTGETDPNSFAMFGTVNGFIGTTAAVLTNDAVQISNPDGTGTIRINRANSRLNGCVIGAPERGCLSTDVPQPRFEFYDERRVALFDAADDSTVSVSPLIGRGNDGLIVNVADAPVGIDTIECKPDDPNCNKTEGE